MGIKIDTRLVSTWLNADASNDAFLKEQLVLNKISEVLIKDKADVIKLLASRGVTIPIDTPNNKYIDHVIAQSKRSEDFVKSIVGLIFKKESNLSADGGGFASFIGSQQGQDAIVSATRIAATLLTKKGKDVKDNVALHEFHEPTITRKTATWGFSLVVVIGIAAIAWILLNKKKGEGNEQITGLGDGQGFAR